MKGYFSRVVIGTGLAVVFSLPASAGVTAYKLDPRHSSAQFAVTHMMISTVRGAFHAVNGSVNLDDNDITKSSVDITIDASTVDTNEPDRDKDLKSPNFFDVAKYPTITFKSTRVDNGAPGHLKVTGDLAMHGVTKSVVLDVTVPKPPIKDPWGLERTAVSGTSKLNRQDFGMTWNKTLDSGGVVVSDNVDITLDVEMIVPPAAK
jgi:polyisoprenoid-binding protein YceI